MIYDTADAWRAAPNKRVVLFAMSGLGKTYVSEMLAETRDWFHYSIDYRIGTRYMSEPIADNLKRAAMEQPFLREMLLLDAIHIAPNIHDHDLNAVSAYLGKPGNTASGGVPMAEYQRRQTQFQNAEIAALLDTPLFMSRAQDIYQYPHFICDTGGSICEWVDADNPSDPILSALAADCLLVWIKGSDAHTKELIKRFDRAPKPMAYQPEFLNAQWQTYLSENDVSEEDVDPDHFVRATYAAALSHRQPRYEAMARNWGITVEADAMMRVSSQQDFVDVIAHALEV